MRFAMELDISLLWRVSRASPDLKSGFGIIALVGVFLHVKRCVSGVSSGSGVWIKKCYLKIPFCGCFVWGKAIWFSLYFVLGNAICNGIGHFPLWRVIRASPDLKCGLGVIALVAVFLHVKRCGVSGIWIKQCYLKIPFCVGRRFVWRKAIR